MRKYAFHWRYDTKAALSLLNWLWVNVNDLMNYYTPTIKPIGWDTDAAGRRKKIYDAPRLPFQRLVDSGALTGSQIQKMRACRASLNPAQLTRNIRDIQGQLERLAKHSNLKLIKRQTTIIPAGTGLGRVS